MIHLFISTTRTPCTRATEVYLLSLIHGRVSLNKFLFKLKLTDSPLCSCGKADEDPTHVVFECEEFKKERRLLELDNQSSLIDYMIQAEIKPGQRDINQLCVLIYIYKSETMPYKCKAQYYFELNFNPREKWSRLNIPMIHNNNLLHFTATYT